ncbi:MAG: S41 family peptidase [Bacteroidota bacterium]|nr:S41 family peptidase [Bacteroidota bacterium]
MKKILILCIISLMTMSMIAQDNPLWMRYPAISPDAQSIVFSYKGDLYTVPASGGEASLLTINEAYDFRPVWSPDGNFIAFASSRYGNFDVYLIPVSGGKAKRLTSNSSNEYPDCFTPDGKFIMFSATIQDDPENVQYPSGILSELYKVPVDGGRSVRILSTVAELAQINEDESLIVYQDRKGYENAWRKHHTSAVTRDIWIYDANTGEHTKLSMFEGEDRNPVFGPGAEEVFYLSEGSGSFNVWKIAAKGAANPEQITAYENNPVRFLSISQNGTLCFGYDGEIYIKQGAAEPEKVNIVIAMDDRYNAVEFMKLSKGARDVDVSKDGEQIALIIRGEVFVTSTDFKTTKRITNTPEQERSVSFSPDGKKLLYASERNGSWNIYETKIVRDEESLFPLATILEETPVIEIEAETFQPSYSPDGKEVAFLEEREALKVINLESREVRMVLDPKYNYSYRDGDQWYQWSPDGKWFMASYSPNAVFFNDVALIDAQGKQEIVNLTKSGYGDGMPKWMMKGKMMIWSSDRNGFRSHGSWGSHDDVYGMFFTQEAFDRFSLNEEELKLLEEKEKKDKDKENGKDKRQKLERSGNPAGAGDKDKKEEGDEEKEDEKVEPIEFELDGLEDRKVKLTIHSSSLADYVLTPDGKKLYYLARFEKGFDLWMNDLLKKETKLVLKLNGKGGGMIMDKKGENLYIFSDGQITRVTTKDNKKKSVAYMAEFYLNKQEERAYMFEHVWRQVDKKFYDPELHGVDWDYYKADYGKFLPYINNNFDFTEMLSEMLGELNASHTGARYRPKNETADQTASLGAFYDNDYDGDGLRVLEIINKGPLDKAEVNVKAGDIIEKIDNVDISADLDYAALLNHKSGKPILLSIYDPVDNKRWDVTVKPINRRQEYQLLYERWVDNMEKLTGELSDGRIGYVHVRGMNSASYREFYSKVLGENFQKEALIVDTRFNGGGWLHDDLVTMLDGKKYVDFYPRGTHYGWEPMNKWIKPSIVLISESNYSDAHGFPYAYKTLEVGELVGMPVPGTMTAVWWEALQDNTVVFGIPQIGTKDADGNYLENLQLEPDYKVSQDPAIVVTGRDEQLEKAVDVMLKQLDEVR